MTDEFQRYWKDNFPCPPVSYLFKSFMADRWLRIHSLPESKRYPENEAEAAEILRRQKIVLDELIGRTDECFFVGIAFGEYPSREYRQIVPDLKRFLTTRTVPVFYREIDGEEDCEPDDAFFVEFGKSTVDRDRLSTVLLAIAEETLSQFFILNPKSNRIFAPYDGGVDLILENADSRDEFEKKYAEWLPVDTKDL
jgi:hypothetical protein